MYEMVVSDVHTVSESAPGVRDGGVLMCAQYLGVCDGSVLMCAQFLQQVPAADAAG